MLILLTIFSEWTLVLLRVVFGLIFLAHGWPKLKDLKANAQNFAMMGFKPGALWGTLVAIVEVLGALAIILGFNTQIAGLLLAGDMLVAALWKIKNGQKLVGGFELDLTLLVAGLILATFGGGAYALDNYINLF